MKAFHLAPYVAVNYFRYSPAGIMPAVEGGKSDFAIVSIVDVTGEAETSHRFDLPFQRAALDMVINAASTAYTLGHTDRANRMRARLGMPRINIAAGSRERQARDRD